MYTRALRALIRDTLSPDIQAGIKYNVIPWLIEVGRRVLPGDCFHIRSEVALASVANGAITGSGTASGSWSRSVATRRSHSGPSAGVSTGSPHTISSIAQRAASSGPMRRSTSVADIRLGRAGQDAAIDLDHGVAGDDVVLDPGVDDVRAEGVAQERAQRPGVHRVARRRERRLGARGSSPGQARAGLAASVGRAAAASSRKRAITGVTRVGRGRPGAR